MPIHEIPSISPSFAINISSFKIKMYPCQIICGRNFFSYEEARLLRLTMMVFLVRLYCTLASDYGLNHEQYLGKSMKEGAVCLLNWFFFGKKIANTIVYLNNHKKKDKASIWVRRKMERDLTAMTGYGDLPDDLLIETLSRLPVKSLMRFMCVSKSWFSLVKDPNFIYKHLNRDDNMRLMVRITYENYDITDPFNDLITCFFLLPDKTLTDLHFQDLEAEMKDHNPLGPCDGIFCFFENSNINLWNVSMNEYRVVPKHKAHLPCDTSIYCRNFGLGLDPMTNDFKLVLILTLYDSKRLSVHDFLPVAVYSFSTDSWRDVEGLFQMEHYYGSNSTDNVYLNGFCYWVAWGHNFYGASILSFSMSDEVFEEIKGPNVPQIMAYDESEMASCRIGIYDGCLSLLCSEESGHSFSLWMMKGGFWTKHLSFGPFMETYQPLGFWRNGEFFLETSDNRLVLYDSTYEETRDLEITGLWFSVNILKESLITFREEDLHNP